MKYIIRNPDSVLRASFGDIPVDFGYTHPEALDDRRPMETALEPEGCECFPESYNQWTADPKAKVIFDDLFRGELRS